MTRRCVALAALLAAMMVLTAAAASHRVPPSSLPAMRGMPAGVDSGPSEEARRVLQSIPEPLAPSERVGPTASALAAAHAADLMRATTARIDSARIGALGDSLLRRDSLATSATAGDSIGADSVGADTAQIPVPEPVPTLAERAAMPMDSTGVAVPPESTRVVPVTPPGPCWGVQVGAPTERAKAESLREAAQSLLLVPMTIVEEKGRHKVRTTHCLAAAAADSLRRRAVMSGFSGAFRFGGHP
ncbi:MAG: hypothetical protein ACHQ52_03165 [Candidatus Eisenbacteria bacterium]